MWVGRPVKHRGKVVHLIDALPTLLALERRAPLLRALWPCRCNAGICRRRLPKAVRQLSAELDWSHCPWGLLRLPPIAQLRTLYGCARVAPLANWPQGYSAWAVVGLLHLQREAER